MKIMVVDDEQLIVQGIIAHLNKMPDLSLQVVGADSGREALEQMDYFAPDLLITDIRMPDMDGLTLIAQVRKRLLCDQFIILTAFETFDYAQKAIENRVMRYLVKPIDWDQLDEAVHLVASARARALDVGAVLGRYAALTEHTRRDDLSHALTRIVRYVRQHPRDVSLVQLAVHSGLSENYICTLFKKELGITFLDYVYELRLHRAMELLLTEPRATVQDVAQQVGYHSDRQLFRLFASKLNMTPQKFRDLYLINEGDTQP